MNHLELWNAGTMFLPTLAFWVYVRPNTLVVAGTAAHALISSIYHLGCYIGHDPVDNTFRVLDQSFIHVAVASQTLGLDYRMKGEANYKAMVVLHSLACVLSLQRREDMTATRRFNIFVSYLLQVMPLFLRNQWKASKTLGTLLLSAALFLVGGVGHPLFHVGLGAVALQLAEFMHGYNSRGWCDGSQHGFFDDYP
jgi:hypothetical protein